MQQRFPYATIQIRVFYAMMLMCLVNFVSFHKLGLHVTLSISKLSK